MNLQVLIVFVTFIKRVTQNEKLNKMYNSISTKVKIYSHFREYIKGVYPIPTFPESVTS